MGVIFRNLDVMDADAGVGVPAGTRRFRTVTGGGAMTSSARSPSNGKASERERAAQRVRVLDAMAEVVAARGLRGASVAAVSRRASVSRATFGELFGGLEDCFLALLDRMLARVTALIDDAFERERDWSDAVLAALEATLMQLDSEPAAARACLLETLAFSAPERKSRAELFERLRLHLDGARGLLSLERQPPVVTAEATLVSVLGILRMRLIAEEAPPFVALLGQLAQLVVAPYFGPAAAVEAGWAGEKRARVLLCERADRPPARSVELPKLLRHASAHRSRACLRYLAERPGASNQAVAEGVGIAHAGQASALLARLDGAGLLVKSCGGPGRPNSWSLSEYGGEVARALMQC
jgi:AcrR family transcriptional regulator